MPVTISALLIALGITLFLLSGFYVVGGALSYALGARKLYAGWQATFFYMLNGVVAAVSLYAVLRTTGMTVLLPVPFLLPFVIRSFNKRLADNPAEQSGPKWGPFLFLFVAVIAYLLWYVLKFTPADKGIIAYTSGDSPFYRAVADLLRTTGKENPMKEYLFPERYSVVPYHYGDLWTSALLSDLGVPESLKFMILETALKALLGLGCVAYAQHLLQKTKVAGWQWLALSIGFFSAFAIFFPRFLLHADVFSYILSYKLLLHTLCLIGVLFVFDEANKIAFLCLCFITGLLYIPAFPGLAVAAFLWIYLDYFFLSRKSVPNPTLSLILVALPVAAYCVVLYKVLPARVQTVNRALADTQVHYSIKDVITGIKILVGGSIQFSVYVPLILLVLVDYLQQKKNGKKSPLTKPALFFVVAFAASLFAWAVTHRFTGEAVQLFHTLSVPLGIVLGLAITIYVAAQEQRMLVKGLAVTIVFAAVLINIGRREDIGNMDREEYGQMSAFIKQFNLQKPLFANLNDTSYLKSTYFAANTVVYQPLAAIAMNVNPYLNFSLNAPYLHFDTSDVVYDFKKSAADWAPFTYYLQKQQLEQVPQVVAMNRFMNQYKIDFLTVPAKLPIPEQLGVSFTDSLTLPKTGWTIYKCRYN